MSDAPAELTQDEVYGALLALFRTTPDASFIVDFDSAEILLVNAAATRLFCCPEERFLGRTGRSLSAPEDYGFVDVFSAKLVRDGEAWHPAYPMMTDDGRRFFADTRVMVAEVGGRRLQLALIRDVSEQIEQSRRLAQTERVAALGRLAGSIAHEINDPATVITNNSELARLRLIGTDDEVRTELDELNRETTLSIRRITDLVRDLARYSTLDDHVTHVSMDDVARSAARVAGPALRMSANVDLSLAAPREVAARRGELVQVVVNLIRNAGQAIGEGAPTDNTVWVETREEDGHVSLTVRDTGPGIDDEVRDQIFAPFVSTKAPGDGSGLGLAIAARLVKAHAGTLWLADTGDEGARFTMRLPVDTGLRPVEKPPTLVSAVAGRRILIADDEPSVGRGLARLLEGTFDVEVVAGGRAALQALERERPFDYILCDVIMPDLDGPALYEQVRTRWPDLALRFVWMTAGGLPGRVDTFLEQHADRVLYKPFMVQDLEALLSRLD